MAAQVGAAETAGVIEMRKRPLDVLAAPAASTASRVGRSPDTDSHRRAPAPRAPSSSTPPAIGFPARWRGRRWPRGEQRSLLWYPVADEIPRDRGCAASSCSPRPAPSRADSWFTTSAPCRVTATSARSPGRRRLACGQVRPAVFHLRDLHPDPTDSPTPRWTSASCAESSGPTPRGWASDARGGRQPREESVTVAGVRRRCSHRRVRLEGRRAIQWFWPLSSPASTSALAPHVKTRPMRLHIDQTAGARDGR